jgi:hypothetical protein
MCSWKLKHSKSGVAAEDETRWKTINPMKLLNLPLHYLQVYVYESKHCKGKRRSHWGSFQKQWWSWLNYFRLSVSYTFFPPFPVSSQKKKLRWLNMHCQWPEILSFRFSEYPFYLFCQCLMFRKWSYAQFFQWHLQCPKPVSTFQVQIQRIIGSSYRALT